MDPATLSSLFEAEPRREVWAAATERMISATLHEDLDDLVVDATVECRTLGCKLVVSGPVEHGEQISMLAQLTPTGIGSIGDETEANGRYHLTYYAFFEPAQRDPAVLAAWYADMRQKIKRNLAEAQEQERGSR